MYNKSLDTASIDSMKEALAKVSLEEADRAKHYKGATPPEDMKNNRKGKGAQDMMQPADNAIANPATDEVQVVNKDFADMTKNVKVAKKRSTDKDTGDKKVVPSGTPMKDPAGPVKTAESVEKTKPQWIIDAYDEMHEAMKKKTGFFDDKIKKDVQNMAKDSKYKGNTTGFEGAVRKKHGAHTDHFVIQNIIRKHAETNENKMDPVGKADADIDNDGDVDSSDKYLHNRRKAIKKSMAKK
tara:strand:- start:18471 stop:19190 length:720 start_codon:yes stop_codon:yes gene_type:complete